MVDGVVDMSGGSILDINYIPPLSAPAIIGAHINMSTSTTIEATIAEIRVLYEAPVEETL